MEVDPPALAKTSVTDIHIESIRTQVEDISGYLQTSPEFFMKRILASGIGDIYSLGKAFRDAEQGQRHNPEFTLLEWYRVGWDEYQLMSEVEALITGVFKSMINAEINIARVSYQDSFQKALKLDPHTASLEALQSMAVGLGYSGWSNETRANCLDLLFSELVESSLPKGLVLVYDYPSCQAALAQMRKDEKGRWVSRRFEVFLNGIELANGYFELRDPQEQTRRFNADIASRKAVNKPYMVLDQNLDKAMQAGLPSCSGIALGVDRLLMQLCGATSISEVIPFSWERC